MNVHLDQPALLLVAAAALPLVALGVVALRAADRLRRAAILAARLLLVALIAVALAGPARKREHDQLAVIALLDVSASVQRFARIPEPAGRTYVQHLRAWLESATTGRRPGDRLGLVVFDGAAIALMAPTTTREIEEDLDVRSVSGTSIDDAIRLGLAMFPADTARRLVLVTDGNETTGDALAAAREAAGGAEGAGAPETARLRRVPIDVVAIDYRIPGDVQIVQMDAPPRGQPGQAASVRVIVESTHDTSGTLTLRREGETVDLNGAAPGRALAIAVPAGRSVHVAPVALADAPVNRFEAIFEPADATLDVLPDNNRAEAFTATPGRGRMLVVDPLMRDGPNPLAATLAAADLPVVTIAPTSFPTDLLSLQNYDLVVLDGVAAYELAPQQHDLIARYVHDLGGGLLMVGGANGFGAGGWNGTRLEDILPLELDPPREMRLPQAALVLVIDQSGSMNRPVAGARASQQQLANEAAAKAIESLRAASLVGVVTFHSFADEFIALQPNDDGAALARRVRTISSGGGTNLRPALRLAHEMLRGVAAERKRVVCMTDGQSEDTDLEPIVRAMVADDIKVSTIAIGDDADHEALRGLAEIGGGEFYPVYNPRALPRVVVDAVQVVNKPLIKEIAFVPRVLATGTTLTAGMSSAPPAAALVVTAPRSDPRAVVDMVHPDGEPLLARWQAGLGRVAAFTSDAYGAWTGAWRDWPAAASFWAQLARATARPGATSEAELVVVADRGQLAIALEAADEEEGFLDFLQVEGLVYRPDGDALPVTLRQTAPGRYETTLPARAAGNYIVALNPRRGSRQLAPVIGGASVAGGEEFRRTTSNTALLERIRAATGGRALDLAAPAGAGLFDRSGMEKSVSLLPMRHELLWLLLGLLMLDVAARRVAWSGSGIRRAIARALGRTAPAGAAGSRSAATLASLRRVSTQVDERFGAEARRAPGPLAPPPPAEKPAHAPASAAEPSRVGAALAALLGRGRSKPTTTQAEEQSRTISPRADDAGREPAPDGATDMTRGLLAAKRRARDRM